MASKEALRVEAKASRFIAQRETGPWSEAEQRAFDRWLTASTLHRVTYYRLHAAWQEAGRLKVLHAGERSVAAPIASNKAQPRQWRGRRVYFAIAAIVTLVAVGVVAFLQDNPFSTDSYRTGIGGLEVVQMTDGSRVMLNTRSQVRIHVDARERRVDLNQGEAFFDVAQDPARPFVVQVGERRVVAVGTQFVVRREPHEMRVSVTEGAVRLEPPRIDSGKKPEGMLLPAGTVVRVEQGNVLVQERSIAKIEEDLSWRGGNLTFNRTPLDEAVAEINRYNTRQIVIRDPSVASIQIGGTFVATKLDSFLRLLESGFPVRITEEGGRIVIDSKRHRL